MIKDYCEKTMSYIAMKKEKIHPNNYKNKGQSV